MQGHEKRRSIVHDGLLLAARLLMTASMIRYGAGKLMDISLFVDNPVTLRFMEALADGAKAPLWFAYSNAIFQTAAGIFVCWSAFTQGAPHCFFSAGSPCSPTSGTRSGRWIPPIAHSMNRCSLGTSRLLLPTS